MTFSVTRRRFWDPRKKKNCYFISFFHFPTESLFCLHNLICFPFWKTKQNISSSTQNYNFYLVKQSQTIFDDKKDNLKFSLPFASCTILWNFFPLIKTYNYFALILQFKSVLVKLTSTVTLGYTELCSL